MEKIKRLEVESCLVWDLSSGRCDCRLGNQETRREEIKSLEVESCLVWDLCANFLPKIECLDVELSRLVFQVVFVGVGIKGGVRGVGTLYRKEWSNISEVSIAAANSCKLLLLSSPIRERGGATFTKYCYFRRDHLRHWLRASTARPPV